MLQASSDSQRDERTLFARLEVLSLHHRDAWGKAYWLCVCACDAFVIVREYHITSGAVKSCGCLRREGQRALATHHRVPKYLHNTWAGIIQRTTNPKAPNWKYYGARGISMHPPWRADFDVFRDDVLRLLGPRPADGFSIDRIDNERGYVPGNIRWATAKVQRRNQRRCMK